MLKVLATVPHWYYVFVVMGPNGPVDRPGTSTVKFLTELKCMQVGTGAAAYVAANSKAVLWYKCVKDHLFDFPPAVR